MASTVARDDPCPCGSGRKYKKCCGAGQTAVAELMPEFMTTEIDAVFDDLLHYAEVKYGDYLESGFLHSLIFPEVDADGDGERNGRETPPGGVLAPPWAEAMESGWVRDGVDEELSDTIGVLVLEFAIFDGLLPGGGTILDNFLRRRGAGMRTFVRRTVDRWVDSRLSVHLVVAHDEETRTVLVHEYLTDQEFSVRYVAGDGLARAKRGDILVTRLIPRGRCHGYTGGFFLVPGLFREAYFVRLMPVMAGLPDLVPGKQGWPALCKAYGWIIIVFTAEFFSRSLGLLPGTAAGEISAEELEWLAFRDSQALETARMLAGRMSADCPVEVVRFAVTFWLHYHLAEAPSYRKPEAMAAAVEYFVRDLQSESPVTQAQAAEKYGVSPGVVGRRQEDLFRFLDEFYPNDGWDDEDEDDGDDLDDHDLYSLFFDDPEEDPKDEEPQ